MKARRKIGRRQFGGKSFEHVLCTTKEKAQIAKKRYMNRGYYVRIAELYPGEFSVYIRNQSNH